MLRRLCTSIALALLASQSLAQTQVGPPTYAVDAQVDLLRGNRFGPYVEILSDTGYRSGGRAAVAAHTRLLPWLNALSTGAGAESSNSVLRARAVSGGEVVYDPVTVPFVRTSAQAQTTRFWSFANDFALDNIPVLLDGEIGLAFAYAELPVQNHARMSYRFELLDAGGTLLQTLYELRAEVRTVAGTNRFQWVPSVGGYADAALWAAAFTPKAVGANWGNAGLAFDVGQLEDLDTPVVLGAGSIYGLRWTLSVETLLSGYSVLGAAVADFGNTAYIGLGRSDSELAALGVTEVLTLPAVPEPGSAWLLGMGLGLLPLLRRLRQGEAA